MAMAYSQYCTCEEPTSVESVVVESDISLREALKAIKAQAIAQTELTCAQQGHDRTVPLEEWGR
jgi:hypothetical protein